ncbi:MAG TPA: TfoX/Sxy family protein [Alphaproteobacteria bacterium]|nr:TfoX/Sxy family protein [Alphaproteobacteria bacterium]
MPGIGPVTAAWLEAVGIATAGELRALGAAGAYRRLKHRDPRGVSLNALWGLHGALAGVPWNRIDAATKARLLAEVAGGP